MKPLVPKHHFKDLLLYCGLSDEAYRLTRPLIWQRNLDTLRITSAMASAMGLLFMLVNLGGNWAPYLVLFIGMILYAVICSRNVRELYQSLRVERLQREIISSLATVMEERDERTGGHIQRTENYVRLLTDRMRALPQYAQFGEDYWKNVMLAASMHDIGKIKIPDHILNKPGRLTDEEYEIMKKHVACGADVIRRTMRNVEEEGYFNVACNIAKYHHERYDGKGYPDGLSGGEHSAGGPDHGAGGRL